MAKDFKKKAQKWKARAKALEARIAEPVEAPKAKVTIVSPLAPRDGFPLLPQIAGAEQAPQFAVRPPQPSAMGPQCTPG